MKILLGRLMGVPVLGPEGRLGTVSDFYFDEGRWAVRFLVCTPSFGLAPKPRIIPSRYFVRKEWDSPGFLVSVPFRGWDSLRTGMTWDQREPAHLQSYREVRRYELRAPSGSLGHCQDFVVDESRWTIPNLVIRVPIRRRSRRVLASPHRIEEIARDDRMFLLDSEALGEEPYPWALGG